MKVDGSTLSPTLTDGRGREESMTGGRKEGRQASMGGRQNKTGTGWEPEPVFPFPPIGSEGIKGKGEGRCKAKTRLEMKAQSSPILHPRAE